MVLFLRPGPFFLSIALAMAAIPQVASVSALDQQLAALGQDWIVYDVSRDPVNAVMADYQLIRVDGIRDDGHCVWNHGLSRDPGEAPKGLVQIAANFRTCQELVKIGHLSATPRQPAPIH
jgi:hypothetical protein